MPQPYSSLVRPVRSWLRMPVRALLPVAGALALSLLTLGLQPAEGQGEAWKQEACEAFADEAREIPIADRDRRQETLDLAERAISCYRNAANETVAEMAYVRMRNLERMERAEEAAEAFVDLQSRLWHLLTPLMQANSYQTESQRLAKRGLLAEALQMDLRAVEIARLLEPLPRAQRIRSLAERFHQVGDPQRADALYAEAEAIALENIDEGPALRRIFSNVRIARATLRIEAALAVGRPTSALEATALLEQHLAEHGLLESEAGEPGTSSYLAYLFPQTQARLTLAQTYRMMEEPDRALAIATSARPYAALQPSNPEWESWTRAEQALALKDLKRFDEARVLLREAVALDTARGDLSFASSSLRDLAVVEEEAAEAYAAGQAPDYQAAEALLREAIAYGEVIRSYIGLTEWSASVFQNRQDPYRHLVRVLIKQGRVEEAFQTLDHTRARHLRDIQALQQLRANIDPSDTQQLDSLSGALAETRLALLTAEPNSGQQAQAQARLLGLQQEMARLTQVDFTPPDPLDVPRLQQTLGDRGQTLLSYFFDQAGSYVLVVRADTLVAVPLSTDPGEVRGLLAQALPMARSEQPWDETEAQPEAPLGHTDNNALHALYRVLVAPASSLIRQGEALVIIAEGPLVGIPFGVLLTSPPPTDGQALPYLIRQHPVAKELAASLVIAGEQPPRHAMGLLAMGRSQFQALPNAARGLRGHTFRSASADSLVNLPAVPQELRRIRQHVRDGHFALDRQATTDRFWREAPRSSVVHLASHALTDEAYPLHSRIVLSPTPADSSASAGSLYLYELMERPLTASLVVLSGCSTAQGDGRLGEGMMGLQYAFRAAGAQSLVATLWPVEDRAMVDLMDRFYYHLREGMSKDRALQQAQVDFLDTHEGLEASPLFWAGTVIYGNTEPVDWGGGGTQRTLWAVLALLALLLAGGLLIRRHLLLA